MGESVFIGKSLPPSPTGPPRSDTPLPRLTPAGADALLRAAAPCGTSPHSTHAGGKTPHRECPAPAVMRARVADPPSAAERGVRLVAGRDGALPPAPPPVAGREWQGPLLRLRPARPRPPAQPPSGYVRRPPGAHRGCARRSATPACWPGAAYR